MRRRLTLTIGLAGLVAGLALGGSSFAASFDCGHAASPREKLICSDPRLSDLDSMLGRLYRERRALLSPHGGELLQTSERSWLDYVGIVCPPAAPHATTCMQQEYGERLKQLADVGQRVGPFRFNRIDIFAAEPAPGDATVRRDFSVHHLAYPQIDGPSSAQQEAWNKQNVRTLKAQDMCMGDPGSDETYYFIGYATHRFISVEWNSWYYCTAMTHDMYADTVENMVLQPVLRPATGPDIFGPTGGWSEKLRQLFRDAFRSEGWYPRAGQAGWIHDQVESQLVRPDSWLFAADGLSVTFGAYDAGCYRCEPPSVTIPWSVIQPLLAKDSVVK